MYEKILVPLDGSKTAEAAMPNAVRLARESGAKVVLLTVDAPAPATGAGNRGKKAMGGNTATLVKPDVQMKAYLDSVAGMLAEVDVEATTVIATGDAATEILAYAADNACDLIIMSTRGRSGLRRGLLGSVTDTVVRASNVPVLTAGPKSVEGKDLDGSICCVAVPLDGSMAATGFIGCSVMQQSGPDLYNGENPAIETAYKSRGKWQEVSDECMMFYSQSAQAMWDPTLSAFNRTRPH